MLSPIVRDVQRQRCWKRGSGDGQRLSLYDYGTTERSFNAVERWGSTLTCTACTAADSEERQICTTCLFAESVALWKRLTCMYAFSHRDHGAHFCLIGGWGKRVDLTWHPAVKHQRPAAKTTNSNCCDRAAAQVKQHIPEQPGWKNSKYWGNIEKRNQINTREMQSIVGQASDFVEVVSKIDWTLLHEIWCRKIEKIKGD